MSRARMQLPGLRAFDANKLIKLFFEISPRNFKHLNSFTVTINRSYDRLAKSMHRNDCYIEENSKMNQSRSYAAQFLQIRSRSDPLVLVVSFTKDATNLSIDSMLPHVNKFKHIFNLIQIIPCV